MIRGPSKLWRDGGFAAEPRRGEAEAVRGAHPKS
jgi:hypothetical protein